MIKEEKYIKKKIQRLVEQYRLIQDIVFIDNFNNMRLAYKISDIAVSASIKPESFGRVAVEAQSMEKLIIAPPLIQPKLHFPSYLMMQDIKQLCLGNSILGIILRE